MQRTNSALRAIGKYQLIASLGQGGMATVYLALVAGPGGFNKLFAVKVLREDLLDGSDEGVQMFWDEARLSAQLTHSNIVQTFEVGQADGHSFLAMEYLDGQTYRGVRARAAGQGGLPLHEELRILAETARGLQYLHELKSHTGASLGVVHRDVSPQNVFITYEGQAKILDLGVAKVATAQHMTQVGVIKGKLEYIAPEQLRGEELDGRADVFALGAMLWESVTGKHFGGGRKVADATRMHNRLSGGERKVLDLVPDAPEELVAIIQHATAVRPADRMPTAAAFAEALDNFLEARGKKPNAKSLAAVLSPLFAADRKEIHELIDEQIQRVKSGSGQGDTMSGALPQIGPSETVSTSGVYVGGRDDSSVSRSEVSVVNPGLLAPRANNKKWLLVGALAASAAVVGMLTLRGPAEQPAPPVSTPPVAVVTPTPVAPSPVAPSAPPSEPSSLVRTILIGVDVAPTNANVTLDGSPVPVPFSGEFQRSGALHQLEAVADGYRPFKRLISFDKTQNIKITLEPLPQQQQQQTARHVAQQRRPASDKRAETTAEPRGEPVTPSSAPPVAAAPPATSETREPGGTLTTKRKLTRGLDHADPYATE